MELSIIPWQVFLDALHKQQSGTLELWLRSWLFSNEGVCSPTIVSQRRIIRLLPGDDKSFCNCKMAGTNVESARQKSAGDEMVSAEFLPKQDHREPNSAATIRWLSSSIERKENCANWKSC